MRAQARVEWETKGAAWLPPGVLFAAAVVPASVVHSAVGLSGPEECTGPLVEFLEDGPLFYLLEGFGQDGSYTALLPAGVPRLRHPMPGTLMHPHSALLLVPAPEVRERAETGPWWVVPLEGPALLCPPDRLATLVDLGRKVLGLAVGGDSDD